MGFIEYIRQDAVLRFPDNGLLKSIGRYFRLPSYKILINYRFTQYVRRKTGGDCSIYADCA